MNDIFGPGSNMSGRVFRDYQKIREIVESSRQLGFKIALTSGTFDLKHAGHDRYLEKAKNSFGNPEKTVLIVGVDSDGKVQARKNRYPVVHEDERLELLCHVRHVDIVFLKEATDEPHQLIKTVHPDMLVISRTTSPTPTNGGAMTAAITRDEEADELRPWCGDVLVLDAQATTSTTARIRLLILDATRDMRQRVDAFYQDMTSYFSQLDGKENQ